MRRMIRIAVALLAFVPISANAALQETILQRFRSISHSASGPLASLVFDAAGNLYGTTSEDGRFEAGTVFELSPPVGGATTWTKSILHTFGSNSRDGAVPTANLIFDSVGHLYGTTSSGGANGYGTVFELTPPVNGKVTWSEKVLTSFPPIDGVQGVTGISPRGGVVFDSSGNLFGTTVEGGNLNCGPVGCGTVFELIPRSHGKAGWHHKIIYTFGGADGALPGAGVILDNLGNLYGTTETGGAGGSGEVFKLSPPSGGGTTWTESILHSFSGPDGNSPDASVVFEPSSGNLYGTTNFGGANAGGYGTVFELSPPQGNQTNWTEQLIYSFSDNDLGKFPLGNVTFDAAGNLYGTTYEGGVIAGGAAFEFVPPDRGKVKWKPILLHRFPNPHRTGLYPAAGLIFDTSGRLYGTTAGGGITDGGTVFQLSL